MVEALDERSPVSADGAARLDAAARSADAALDDLLNDLAVADADVVLVLDDLHVIESPAIHQQLAFLLDHLPARAHVVIGYPGRSADAARAPARARRTRRDPGRATCGSRRDEAASYLNEVDGAAR